MMQIVPKWRVLVKFPDHDDVEFWIYDNSVANVLRKIADMQFTENGLEQPAQILIGTAQ